MIFSPENYPAGWIKQGEQVIFLENYKIRGAVIGGQDRLIFESETSGGGEIGIKSQLYGRTLTFNLTAFRYVVDNLQVQVFDGAAVQFSTFNAGEVTTQGIEFDADWRTPVEGLGIFGSFSYLDAEFSDTFIGLDGLDLNGRDLGRAPSVAFNVGADYQHALSNDLTLGLNGNLAYSGSYFVADNVLNDLVQDSFVTLDAAISLRSDSGKWELSVFGTNLTDEIFIVNGVPRPFGFITDPFGPSDDTVVNISRGRQLFVGLKYGF